MCVTPITLWVVSKNESNRLSENEMVSTLIWRHVSLLYVVQSNILWLTILLSYQYRCNVVFTNYSIARNSEPLPPAKRDETLSYALFLFIGKCMEMIV